MRFRPETFMRTPLNIILSALDYGAKFQKSDLHLDELGIASLCALFVNANRDPKKGNPAKPSDFYRFADNDDKLAAHACDAFFSLVADKLLPSWALAIAPLEELRSQRKFDSFPRPRVWLADGVMLICPHFSGDRVFAPLALIEHSGGIARVSDPDNDKIYDVLLESTPEGECAYWEKDFEAECDWIMEENGSG
jgi:hypothetical protein